MDQGDDDASPKRAKNVDTSSASPTPPPVFYAMRSPVDFWFPDGNVVIRAPVLVGSWTGVYKLHQSVLSRDCGAFARLFAAIASGLDPSACVDLAAIFVKDVDLQGCPTYFLRTVLDKDFFYLLQALYTPFLCVHSSLPIMRG